MKVVVITDQFPPQMGGMSNHALNISHHLLKNGHNVTVIKGKKFRKRLQDESFNVFHVLTFKYPTIDSFMIRLLLIKLNPDIVHVCNAGLISRIVETRYNTINRVVGNDFLNPWCGFRFPFRRFLYRIPLNKFRTALKINEMNLRKSIIIERLKLCENIIVNSEWTKQQLIHLYISEEKIRVVTGGVDTHIFKPCNNKRDIRKALNLPLNSKIFLSVSNLVKSKGIDIVIKSLPRIIEKVPDVYLIIVGDGIEKSYLQSLVIDLKLEDYVSFTGRLEPKRVARYYQSADIYVQPSRSEKTETGFIGVSETMGRTFLEAGACGIPVITTNSGGIPSVVEHLKNGILLDDPLDMEALVDNILLLINDRKLRDQMGENGMKKVKIRFSWERIGGTIEHMMNRIVS